MSALHEVSESAASVPFRTQVDPAWLDRVGYFEFLNRAFPNQWNNATYDWYIARNFADRRNELVVRAEGHRVVAGVAMSPRRIAVDALPPIDVCVLTAAATLPCERGRGHYLRVVQGALSRAREKSCTALLGFVTRDNPSSRGLLRLGAHAIPSYYILSTHRSDLRHRRHGAAARVTPPSPRERRRALAVALDLLGRTRSSGSQHSLATFHYGRVEEWLQQFVERPYPVRILRLAPDSVALIESVGETDRLQWLACPDGERAANVARLATTSGACARKFFMYTLDPLEATAAKRAGLAVRDGYLLLLPTDPASASWHRLVNAGWSVQSGDRV